MIIATSLQQGLEAVCHSATDSALPGEQRLRAPGDTLVIHLTLTQEVSWFLSSAEQERGCSDPPGKLHALLTSLSAQEPGLRGGLVYTRLNWSCTPANSVVPEQNPLLSLGPDSLSTPRGTVQPQSFMLQCSEVLKQIVNKP